MDKKIIYDLGANIGLNIPYYLLKADLTVAVEANPRLAAELRTNFADEIYHGRLAIVESAVTAAEQCNKEIDFFVYQGASKYGHVLSTLEDSVGADSPKFKRISVPTVSVTELFSTFGPPHYVKIDIEHHDAVVLRELLQTDWRPDYVSAEAHDPSVAALLLLAEEFVGFKIVEGESVGFEFAETTIRTGDGLKPWSFPYHSAGPFGDDLPGSWLDRKSLLQSYAAIGPGWLDLHASRRDVGIRRDFGDRAEPQGVIGPAIEASGLLRAAVRNLPRAVKNRLDAHRLKS